MAGFNTLEMALIKAQQKAAEQAAKRAAKGAIGAKKILQEPTISIAESEVLKKPTNEDAFSNYHDMLTVLRKSEKVADRSLSIAALLLYARNGGQLHQI